MKYSPFIGIVLAMFIAWKKKERTDFTGRWLLDTSQAINLPQVYTRLDSVMMNVRQHGDSIFVVTEMSSAGRRVKTPEALYTIGDEEQYREDTAVGMKRLTRGSWSNEGSMFTVTNRIAQRSRSGELAYTQTDVWDLPRPDELRIAMTLVTADSHAAPTQRRVFRRLKQ